MSGTGVRLSAEDQAALAMLEARVEAGVAAIDRMIEAGKALAMIRQRQLFRGTAATWEQYVQTRFNLTKRRADQLVGFTQVQTVLDEMGTAVPKMSERSIRPLVGLDRDAVIEAVAEAAADPAGISPASIRKAVSRRKKTKAAKAPRPRRFKVPGGVVTVMLNRRSDGSVLNALAAATTQAENELEAQASEAA